MDEGSRFQEPVIGESGHRRPRHGIFLAASPQRAPAKIGDAIAKCHGRPRVHCKRVIRQVAAYHCLSECPWMGIGSCMHRHNCVRLLESIGTYASIATSLQNNTPMRQHDLRLLAAHPWPSNQEHKDFVSVCNTSNVPLLLRQELKNLSGPCRIRAPAYIGRLDSGRCDVRGDSDEAVLRHQCL